MALAATVCALLAVDRASALGDPLRRGRRCYTTAPADLTLELVLANAERVLALVDGGICIIRMIGNVWIPQEAKNNSQYWRIRAQNQSVLSYERLPVDNGWKRSIVMERVR
jgi:hypothetical protein